MSITKSVQTMFKTTDGKLFDTLIDATTHEIITEAVQQLKRILEPDSICKKCYEISILLLGIINARKEIITILSDVDNNIIVGNYTQVLQESKTTIDDTNLRHIHKNEK